MASAEVSEMAVVYYTNSQSGDFPADGVSSPSVVFGFHPLFGA